MTVDLDELLRRGGQSTIDLLNFAIYSVQPEPVFVFLVQEYRYGPTAARALVLHDVFCAPGSPFRLRASEILEPRDLRLRSSLDPLRQAIERRFSMDDDGETDECETPNVPIPAAHLFDFLVSHLRGLSEGPLQQIIATYDPARTPVENLPNGRMTVGQRAFVERVWRPAIRPRLAASGFWRVTTLGG